MSGYGSDANGVITPKSNSSPGGPGGNAFPKWLYNSTLSPVIVQNQGQENTLLAAGWTESPSGAAATPTSVSITLKLPTTMSTTGFANDAAAAAGGIQVGQVYHNSGALRVRLS